MEQTATISQRASAKCPTCGAPAKRQPRSLDQHRRYFALIKSAFHHWPEAHEKQFGDETELRKWLQMRAGYREIGAKIPLVGLNRDRAVMLVEAAIRAAGSYAVPVVHGDTLVVFKPKSIKFDSMPHLEFCGLNNAVDDVLRAEGVDPDQLLAHGVPA